MIVWEMNFMMKRQNRILLLLFLSALISQSGIEALAGQVRLAKSLPTVFAIEPDSTDLNRVCAIVKTIDLPVRPFSCPNAFLNSLNKFAIGCVVTELRMQKMSGIQLQKTLADRGVDLPIIIVTAHAEVLMAVNAMKGGAVDFIEKPYSPQQLLEQIQIGLKISQAKFDQRALFEKFNKRVEKLSRREKEILGFLLIGATIKGIAYDLELSPKTVGKHRINILNKIKADDQHDLIVLSIKAGWNHEQVDD